MRLKRLVYGKLKEFILLGSLIISSFACVAEETGVIPAEISAAGVAGTQGQTDALANSVVKVFSSVRPPDHFKPWSKQAPTEITGSGVVIEGNRILTCAHLLLYAGQVQVLANQAGDKISAQVEVIAPEIDLAVLKLSDNTFFDSHPPLVRATALPNVRDAVTAYGYPQGGNALSVTKGIVSRIEFASYNLPVSGLRVQIDAAINPGNSGGPAVVGNKMIGLVFSRLGRAENISYIIPEEEIDLFLQAVASGKKYGKPMFFDECQMLGNGTIRSYLKLTNNVRGVIVHKVASTNADYPLKKWDVITKIGDLPLDDQGMVSLDNGTKVFFKYMCQKIAKDGKVPLTLVREGRQIETTVPVTTEFPRLVPDLNGNYPAYFIYGPMVFSPASGELLNDLSAGNQGSLRLMVLGYSGSPLVKRMGDSPAFPGEELVVVPSPFFPHPLAQGYSNPFLEVVESINDIPVKNLRHAVEILRDAKDKYVRIEFAGRNRQTVIFPREETVAATDDILSDNGIRSQGSPDLLAIWHGKPADSK